MTDNDEAIEEIEERFKVTLEPVSFNSNFQSEIEKTLLKHFENDQRKKYYVLRIQSITVISNIINGNSQCIVDVNASLVIFKPRISKHLYFEIIDVDLKNNYSVGLFGRFKVSIEGILEKKKIVKVKIEHLKNFKNEIIGIGSLVSIVE
jgi:DNA-directed RNA polymerase subunit E'/Rpb7